MKLTMRDAGKILIVWFVWLMGEIALERAGFDDRASFAWFVAISLFSFTYGRHAFRRERQKS